MKFLVVNGPNINMTGIREQGVYGARNYTEIMAMIAAEAKQRGIEVEVFQSNIEGEMINAIQRCYFEHMDGLIINPGAYTHTSYALHDAIKSIAPIPAVEVHFSNVHARESFRHCLLYTSPGRKSLSPLSSTRIFFSIWRTIISICLSLISTPCSRYTRCTS